MAKQEVKQESKQENKPAPTPENNSPKQPTDNQNKQKESRDRDVPASPGGPIYINGEGGSGSIGSNNIDTTDLKAATAAAEAAAAAALAAELAAAKSKQSENNNNNNNKSENGSLQEKLNTLIPESKTTKGELTCDIEIDNLKKKVEDTINELQNKVKQLQNNTTSNENSEKYMALLMRELLDKQILDEDDITNIDNKLDSKVITVDDVIKHLERLKLISKPKTKDTVDARSQKGEFGYNELPPDFYKPLGSNELSLWDNQYSILNTDKWKVPMPNPPVCVNNTPCNVCPTTEPEGTAGYPLNLKEWDSSRKFTNMPTNKDWAKSQIDNKGGDIYKYSMKNIAIQNESSRNYDRHPKSEINSNIIINKRLQKQESEVESKPEIEINKTKVEEAKSKVEEVKSKEIGRAHV